MDHTGFVKTEAARRDGASDEVTSGGPVTHSTVSGLLTEGRDVPPPKGADDAAPAELARHLVEVVE